MKRNYFISGAIIVLFAGLLFAKLGRSSVPISNATVIEKPHAKVYLFLNEKDRDEGCSRIYSLFDEGSKKLPDNVESLRIDVNNESEKELFKKYEIRVLPTILFINPRNELKKKIEGEGSEVEGKINDAFKNAAEILKP